MKAKITDKGLTLKRDWFGDCAEVEIVKNGSTLVIAPAVVRREGGVAKSSPSDPIWNLARNPIMDDPLTDGSVRLDEIVYHGK